MPYTAGIPGELRITYSPLPRPVRIQNLDTGRGYNASCFNPVTGELSEAGPVGTDATGSWTANPPPGTKTDWVLVSNGKPTRMRGQGILACSQIPPCIRLPGGWAAMIEASAISRLPPAAADVFLGQHLSRQSHEDRVVTELG